MKLKVWCHYEKSNYSVTPAKAGVHNYFAIMDDLSSTE